MAILGLILGVLAGAVIWLIRLNMAADAARDLTDTASDMKGLFRRWRWQKKLSVDHIAEITDPRIAATAMMVVLAQSDGAMTDAERKTILEHVTGPLGASEAQSEELLAHCRWLVRDLDDADNTFRRLTPVILKSCGKKEIAELLEMLASVAAADGKADDIELNAIERLRRALAQR